MLEDDDLDAAIAAGIITTDQVEKLRAFADGRRRSAERADDERFRFMRGFNDFFFAVGIVLFGLGIIYFAGVNPLYNLVAAALIWALAELLVRRMRLVLPGILLTCLFVFFVYRLTELDWSWLSKLTGLPLGPPSRGSGYSSPVLGSIDPLAVTAKALAATLAAVVFYARFRLPFALLVIASGLVLFIAAIFSAVLFPGIVARSSILLACGLAVFAAAMAYDLSDPKRLTRSADCAFWLHLLAAPLIVHSLIQFILPSYRGAQFSMTPGSATAIFVVVACLAAVAILIDRRALLVSALTYLGIAIGYAISGALRTGKTDESAVLFATFVILGAMVLALGVGWQPLRRLVLRLFPAIIVNRLPPAAYSV